jgi:Domain of unknown function (DUF4157)
MTSRLAYVGSQSAPATASEQHSDDRALVGPGHGSPIPPVDQLEVDSERRLGAAAAVERAGASGGVPLDPASRARAESSLGVDLDGVRVHTGAAAAEAAESISARAYTRGQDIYFGAGFHQPGTAQGDRLMAHELVHVAQQASSPAAEPQRYALEVSDASDGAEIEAERGADAIMAGRSFHATASPGSGTLSRGAGPRSGPAGKPGTKSVEDALGDAVVDTLPGDGWEMVVFYKAIAAGDKAGALGTWELVPEPTRKVVDSPAVLRRLKGFPASLADRPGESVVETLGPASIGILASAGVGFRPSFADIILRDAASAAAWVAALQAQPAQLRAFLAALPTAETVTPEQARHMAAFAAGMPGNYPRMLFERIYPRLVDTTYDASQVKTRKWEAVDVNRMFKGLADNLPVAHVHTIVKGFYLGTHEVTGDGDKELGYGWYTSDGRVVMPAGKSYVPTDAGHGASGGSATTSGRKLGHFDSTLLHEVGHGVGAHTDGNEWARTWGDWKKHGMDEWSQKLFDDSAVQPAYHSLLGSAATMPPWQARLWMASAVAGRTPDVAVTFGLLGTRLWTKADVATFVKTNYGGQPLTKYFLRVMQGLGPENAYRVSSDNVGTDGRYYAYISRWEDSHCSYAPKVATSPVSPYSLSSYKEWFAEQYTEYYRTGKAAGSQPPSVKQKLDELDAMKWDEKASKLEPPGAADDSTPMKHRSEDRAQAFRRIFPWLST